MKTKRVLIPIIIIIVVVAGIYAAFKIYGDKSSGSDKTTIFAKCLMEKGVLVYGSKYCPHCSDQKKLFGSAFKYVNYIECADDVKKCQDAGVNAIPAWHFPDGKKIEGFLQFSELSELSGCPL